MDMYIRELAFCGTFCHLMGYDHMEDDERIVMEENKEKNFRSLEGD